MRALSLPWLLAAAGARALSDPDRIRQRMGGGQRHPTSVAAQIDDAVARDDLDEAERLLALVPDGDPERMSLAAAVQFLAGDVAAAEESARSSTQGRGRARRVLRRAQAWRAELGPDLAAARAATIATPVHRAERDAQVRPRILHVVKTSLPQVQAGYTLRTHAVLRAQRDAGWDVRAVTRLGFPVVQGHLAERRDVVDGIDYRRLLSARGSDVLQFADRLAGIARRLDIDLLHAASDHVNGHAALLATQSLDVPVVYEVRGFLEDSWACQHGGDRRAAATERYRLARARETEVMLAADAVVTLSSTMAADIVARGVPAERVHLVPNGVDDAFLAPVRDAAQVRARLGLPDDRLWVGAVTGIHAFEGLPTLVEAVRIARADGLDVGAVIVGDGPARVDLQRLLPADGSVRWIPRVDPGAARDWYDALDAVLVPRIDARVTRLVTPLKPVEALARQRLVIASDLPALREATGGHARFVAPGSAQDLAAELGEVSAHRDLAVAGRAWVSAERRWQHVCAGYRAAYASAR